MFIEIFQYIIHPVYNYDCLLGEPSRLCSIYTDWSTGDYMQYYTWMVAGANGIMGILFLFRKKAFPHGGPIESWLSLCMSIIFFLLSFLGILVVINTDNFSLFFLSLIIGGLFFFRFKRSGSKDIHYGNISLSLLMLLLLNMTMSSTLFYGDLNIGRILLITLFLISFLWAIRLKELSFLQASSDFLFACILFSSVYLRGFGGDLETHGQVIFRYGLILIAFSFLVTSLLIVSRLVYLALGEKQRTQLSNVGK